VLVLAHGDRMTRPRAALLAALPFVVFAGWVVGFCLLPEPWVFWVFALPFAGLLGVLAVALWWQIYAGAPR